MFIPIPEIPKVTSVSQRTAALIRTFQKHDPIKQHVSPTVISAVCSFIQTLTLTDHEENKGVKRKWKFSTGVFPGNVPQVVAWTLQAEFVKIQAVLQQTAQLKAKRLEVLTEKKKKKNLKIKSSTSSSSCSSFLPPLAESLCLRRLSESESSVWGSSRRRTASHLYLEGGKEIKNKGQGQTGTSVNQSLGHGGMKDVRERNLSWQRAPSSCFSWILMRPLNWASLFHSLGCILFWKKEKNWTTSVVKNQHFWTFLHFLLRS